MKSTLKLFLDGKLKKDPEQSKFEGSTFLRHACVKEKGVCLDDSWYDAVEDEAWYVDVLDDGTAITYCGNK
jgi:hypothetical protein